MKWWFPWRGFPPSSVKCQIISYSLDLFYKKTRLTCCYMGFPECDCFFSNVLALLLMCSFMVWTYSHWNQWKSFHFFTESSTVDLITNLVSFTCLLQPQCQTSVLDCSSTEVPRGVWIQFQLSSFVPCSLILLFLAVLSQILFSLRISTLYK